MLAGKAAKFRFRRQSPRYHAEFTVFAVAQRTRLVKVSAQFDVAVKQLLVAAGEWNVGIV